MTKSQALLSGVAALLLACIPACAQRFVVIDQDGSGPGGSNQMAMMVLLESPKVQVLGITMVSGNAWEPEEVQHTLRTLELIGRTDVPVAAGAVYPLVRTQEETMLEKPLIGSFAWYGAWGDLAMKTSGQPYHDAYVLPAMEEGAPTHKAIEEDAAHFLVRQVRAHPHQVTIYAAGPLTNIALAISIDPQFAELAEGIVIMGGSLAPRTDDAEFRTHPAHEFNLWWDPEAAHITLRANWKRIEMTTVDISVKTFFTKEMQMEISKSNSLAAQYIAKYTHENYYMWDELAAAAWLDPTIITKEETLYMDVDVTRGVNYGDTLSWTGENKPKYTLQPVHVWVDVDNAKFNRMFVDLMTGRR
jgi:inosine-uridine nucleoside N-ribohydrolase